MLCIILLPLLHLILIILILAPEVDQLA